jgi:peptide/nickel transport system substrate-binding protein
MRLSGDVRFRIRGSRMIRSHDRERRLSRRAILRGSALGAGGVAGFALGCNSSRRAATGGQPAATGSRAVKQPRAGGILNHPGGTAGSFDTLGLTFDPHIQGLSAEQSYTLFYERLLGYNPLTFKVEPELAQKWELVSPTEYRFTLQPGVKWHNKPPANGRLLTAEDILYSLQRVQSNDPKFVNRSLLSFVDKATAPDPGTIVLTTKGPNAGALLTLAHDSLAVVARETIEKYPKPISADQVVGTGAFMMASIEENVGGDYARNPDYWKPGRPYLDRLRTRQFNDLLSAWSAFLAGQVDVALIPGTEVKEFVGRQGQGYSPAWSPDYTVSICIPNTRSKPMDDGRVVRALRLFIDHDEFITAWANPQYGHGGYGSIFAAALSNWDLTEDEYRSFLEWKHPKDDAASEALSLLSAAGYGRDNPLRFTLNAVNKDHDQAAVQLLQSQWKRLSQGVVDAQIKLTDTATASGLRSTHAFTWGNYGISPGMPDPDPWLTSCYRTGGSQNFTGFSDPRVDAMIDQQRTIFDETQRKAAVKDIIRYMIDHGPNTITATRYFLNAVSPKVQGFQPEYYLNGRLYQSVWLAS